MRVRDLEIGKDDAMIYKWASSGYVEHLLKKKENSSLAYTTYQETDDKLYQESSKNVYSLSSKTQKPYKETGVKIRIGGPEEKEGGGDGKDDKGAHGGAKEADQEPEK